MAGNSSLNKAAQAKQDEFYTQLADIENELRHYKAHFKGKVVFCNCDDPYESNFFKYFAMNFNYLGLKKLITTCYVSSPVVYTQLSLFDDMAYSVSAPANSKKKPYKVEITEVDDENKDGAFDLEDIKHLLKNKKNVCTMLDGDGDFRSKECIDLLLEADIVVTNPPFSIFREFFAKLVEYKKGFVILAPKNAIHYKEIFPYIKNNQAWIGYTPMGKDLLFNVSSDLADHLVKSNKPGSGYKIVNGVILGRAPVVWITNLDITKRHEEMILYKRFIPSEYPKYENYNAIDVSRVSDIPCDYFGDIGVPDTFLEHYNPDQFEIIGLGCGDLAKEIGIRKNHRGRTDVAYKDRDGTDKCPYSRIIIRRKEQK